MLQPKYTLIEILHDKWWIAALSFGVSVILTPVVRLIAYRTNIIDRPDELLKPHGRPIAYLGGVAIVLGLVAGVASYLAVMPDAAENYARLRTDLGSGEFANLLDNPLWNLLGISLAAVLTTVVGLLDDIFIISPTQKILGQVMAAALLLAGGIGHRMGLLFLTPLGLPDQGPLLIPASSLLLVFMVICTCNATNLLDGLDGLCGGVTGIIALGFLGLGVWLAMWGGYPGMDELRVGLCLAMAGAVIGFLVFNIPPASIFMGDAGSMLLGLFVAAMLAMFAQDANPRWFIAACVVFSLPVLDTGLAVVRRLLSGQSIFVGDRSHLYDQLVDRGMTVKQVVVLFYFLAAITAVIGVASAVYLRTRYALALDVALVVTVGIVFHKLGMIAPPPRQPTASGGGGRAPSPAGSAPSSSRGDTAH